MPRLFGLSKVNRRNLTSCRMMSSASRCENLVLRLHEVQAVKFGNFKLKSGIYSPFYLDLRVIISYPDLLQEVADLMWDTVKDVNCDMLCGVPYTALPIATAISLKQGKPMLMRRKEVKDYGTKKAIEGMFSGGEEVLIVEDLVTSGASILETVEPLVHEGLSVKHAVVLIDREQGGYHTLEQSGIQLHRVLQISFLLEILREKGLVDDELRDRVASFLAENQTTETKKPERLSYKQRGELSQCLLAKKCFDVMERKNTNLAVAADVAKSAELIAIADKVGPHICVLKTHVDILEDWNQSVAQQLKDLSLKHDFLIFEDRKFADIGNTVVQQYAAGVYRIADWADITNAHLVPGPGVIDGLASVGKDRNQGLLLLAEMSSKGSLAKGAYTDSVIEAALNNSDYVMGFISINPASWKGVQTNKAFHGMVQMTPGVSLAEGGDALGQQYNTPASVIGQRGSDVIIVGRGIIKAEDVAQAAIEYKEAGWNAYLNSIKNF